MNHIVSCHHPSAGGMFDSKWATPVSDGQLVLDFIAYRNKGRMEV